MVQSEHKEQARKLLMLVEHEEIKESIVEDLSSFFQVVVFTDPEEALSYIEKEQPDIVVTDLYLITEKDYGIEVGIEFIRRLKSKLESKKIPVVALTKYLPIAVLSKYGMYFDPRWTATLKKEGMQFGAGKRYKYRDLCKFEQQLKELGIGPDKIFNKREYNERPEGYKKLAQQLNILIEKEKGKSSA